MSVIPNWDVPMSRLSRIMLAGAVGLLAACAGSEPVASAPELNAIIGGEPDLAHANVGALLYDLDGQGTPSNEDLLCSGSYVGAGLTGTGAAVDVFLTAGHCLAWIREPVKTMWVTFDRDLTDGVTGEIEVIGTVVDPGFGHNEGDGHDLALVFLPPGSVSADPASLPTTDLLGTMAARGGLRGALFENVGYGGSMEFKRGWPRLSYPDKRQTSLSPFMALTPSRLGLLINQDATAQGGDCYGDSGSPKFLQGGDGTILAIVSWGDANCRATSWSQRLDTPSALAFLRTYLPQ
jgi:hypothetical protein